MENFIKETRLRFSFPHLPLIIHVGMGLSGEAIKLVPEDLLTDPQSKSTLWAMSEEAIGEEFIIVN